MLNYIIFEQVEQKIWAKELKYVYVTIGSRIRIGNIVINNYLEIFCKMIHFLLRTPTIVTRALRDCISNKINTGIH